MAGAVREVSVHRGFDPRDFALLGFRRGLMFAMSVAELGIERVIIPKPRALVRARSDARRRPSTLLPRLPQMPI